MLEQFTIQVRRFLLIICIVGLVGAGLSACTQDTPTAVSQKPITIGTSLSFSEKWRTAWSPG